MLRFYWCLYCQCWFGFVLVELGDDCVDLGQCLQVVVGYVVGYFGDVCVYVCVIEFFGCYYFIGCCFYQWGVVEEDGVLFVYDYCFIVYCWYVGVIGGV